MNAKIKKSGIEPAEPVTKSLGKDDVNSIAHSLTDVKPFKDAHE